MNIPDRPLSFGVKTSQQGLSYDEILRIWREADQIPLFEHAWLWDHMVPLRGDIRGSRAGSLDAPRRPGRSDPPLTAGGHRDQQPPPKAHAAGEDGGHRRHHLRRSTRRRDRSRWEPGGGRKPRDPRVRGLRGASGPAGRRGWRLGRVLRDTATDVDGDRTVRFRRPLDPTQGRGCEPKPLQHPHPPILIGGWGERVLGIVAEYADIWNCPANTARQFEEKNAILIGHCAAIGRDPNEIVRSVQMIVRSDEPGAPATTRAGILEMIEAGITHFVLAAVPGGRPVSGWSKRSSSPSSPRCRRADNFAECGTWRRNVNRRAAKRVGRRSRRASPEWTARRRCQSE